MVVVVSRGLEVVGEDARVRPRVRVCGFRFEGISDALSFTHSTCTTHATERCRKLYATR